ncbi:MAG: hypothetical protein SH819_02820 [Cytophagales bacterium]|nr:hypothetical protein [Cytophagales bacterium]
MQSTRDKSSILVAAIRQHTSVIHDFGERIRQMMSTSGNVNEEEYDSQEQSFKAETSAKVNLLSEQLAFANKELDELTRMKQNIAVNHTQVGLGSVVTTDRDTFFVSASIERFHVDGVPYFGLSIHTPLYKEMKGKKAGETFSYKKTTYTIKEIS